MNRIYHHSPKTPRPPPPQPNHNPNNKPHHLKQHVILPKQARRNEQNFPSFPSPPPPPPQKKKIRSGLTDAIFYFWHATVVNSNVFSATISIIDYNILRSEIIINVQVHPINYNELIITNVSFMFKYTFSFLRHLHLSLQLKVEKKWQNFPKKYRT